MAYVTLRNFIEPVTRVFDTRTVSNHLPMEIEVRSVGGNFKLKPRQSAKVKESFFGDDLEVWYLERRIMHGTLEPTDTIHIGSIKSASIERRMIATKGDFEHLTFHNLLKIPVSIYYRGNKIGIVGGYDGKGYFGGSSSVLDLNNETFGFYLGEFITFKLCGLDPSNPRKETPWKSVELIDSLMTDIYLGGISFGFVPPPPDTYAYRFNSPQMGFVGQTFYTNAGRKDPYSTYPTNPLAPF